MLYRFYFYPGKAITAFKAFLSVQVKKSGVLLAVIIDIVPT
jgi:hypothetical protein